jgi:hypothetical protein
MSETYYSDKYEIFKQKALELLSKQRRKDGYTNFDSIVDSAFRSAGLIEESRITYTRSLKKEPEIKEFLRIERERQKQKGENPELHQTHMFK